MNERLSSELRGAQMELKNLGDKASLLQTLDGALYEATESLQRLRTLAVSASSAHLSTEDRLAMEEEEAQAEADYNEEALDELVETAASNMANDAVDELDEGLGDMM